MFEVDFMQPMNLYIPLQTGLNNPNCFWAELVVAVTIDSDDFIGSFKLGRSVHYQKVTIMPLGNGTHTEFYRHISN